MSSTALDLSVSSLSCHIMSIVVVIAIVSCLDCLIRLVDALLLLEHNYGSKLSFSISLMFEGNKDMLDVKGWLDERKAHLRKNIPSAELSPFI